jgi:transposase-like protein
LARDLSQLTVAAMMVDGIHIAEHLMVVALAITTDGTKVPVGLYEGDTENTTVITGLLADLVDRGLDTSGGILFVLDGAKALTKAVRKVFGRRALIQRCTLHKRRNVADHLPDAEPELVDRKLVRAFIHTPTSGCAPPLSWPLHWNARIRRPRPASGRAWRRCSPSAGSAYPPAWTAP